MAKDESAAERAGLSVPGLLSLLVIWVVWGSTYLAIRVAVRPGSGFGPFWLGASRVLVAGAILLALAAASGRRVRPSRRELAVLAASGLLMWVGGNGGVNWAEQRVDSGLVALVVGTMPIWVALIEAWLDRRRPSPLLLGSLLVGFAGLAVLTAPLLEAGVAGSLAGIAAVLAGTLCWGLGSILVNRRPVGLAPLASSAWQQLAGGVGFVLVAVAVGEAVPDPTPAAWLAWAYLVGFGSLLAFTCYVVALRTLPTTVVMTYTYVNPVIAVSLGWLLLDEPLTGWTALATALILLGVAGVFRSRARVRRSPPPSLTTPRVG
jgi:drug/metabolite transporter (DMT)-like permease